jgi:hypothetical protein
METILKNIVLLIVLTLPTIAVAQNAAELPKSYVDRIMPDVQLGTLICENAEGKRVLCSGDVEETILGIATNVPYVTINKPAAPNSSKFIFDALVSTANGKISKGDYLSASSGGTLAKASSVELAYAVAIEDASEAKKIKVKVLKR